MLIAVAGTILGLVVLTYAADQFVVGAARVAAVVRLSPIVVGAVVIGFGTSAPELVVSGLASARGSVDLAVGNVVGSNAANLTLVLGAAALVTPIVVRSPVLKREAPLSLAAVVLFGLFVQRGIGLVGGAVLSVVLVVALAIIVLSARGGDPGLSSQVEEFLTDRPPSLRREVVRTSFGLLLVLGAAQLLVVSATAIATRLGVAEGFIGLTVVAIGTSLPELATAIQAARKAETDLVVGNLLGSNLFNAAGVGALIGFLGGGTSIDPTIAGAGVIVMVAIAVVATGFMMTGKRVVRWEGAVLLLAYAATLPFLAG
jgi:cation:H+ antiporter